MPIATVLTFLVCAASAFVIGRAADGADLAPLFIAARLAATGRADGIYVHEPGYLDIFDSALWVGAAESVGYSISHLYVYLYPPLWAGLLAPITCFVDFPTFHAVMRVLNVGALGATVLATAAQWNPRFLRPLPLMMCLAGLVFSMAAFRSAWLGQVHPIVILLVVVAMAASQGGRPALAGGALAIAAAIKITPAVLAIYWLLTRRRECALWFAGFAVALAILSVGLLGWDVHVAFIESVARVSRALVTTSDNQSLVAWLAFNEHPVWRLLSVEVYEAPTWARTVVLIFAVGMFALIALPATDITDENLDALAMIGLFLVATVASPLAWRHHFVVLVVPLMLIARNRAGLLFALAMGILLSMKVYMTGQNLAESGHRILIWNELAVGVTTLAFIAAILWKQTGMRQGAAQIAPR